jgi:hypothetical protein
VRPGSADPDQPEARAAQHRTLAAWSLLHELAGVKTPWELRFDDPSREWRRLFSEFFGTFLLVLAGAGAGSSTRSATARSGAAPLSARPASR